MEKLLAISISGYPGQIPIPTASSSSGVDFNTIFRFGLNLLILAGLITVIIYLLLAGIKWITSGGDKEKVESARKGITYSIIGLVIILISFLIINLIGQIFGVGNLQMFGVPKTEVHTKPPEPPEPTRRPVMRPKS